MNINQIEMVSVDSLVPANHPYRKLKEVLDFERLTKSVKVEVSETGAVGYTVPRLVMCLILQFIEDHSDRMFERFIAESIVAKFFCSFGLTEKTPDYTTICKFRNKLGLEQLEILFMAAREQIEEQGHIQELFTFVDSTALISKLQMWEERDKAISEGYEKFTNEVIEKYAKDKEVRIGCKGDKKFWFGFKKHVSVDMQSGMINKVKVTKANVSDDNEEAVKAILPSRGAIAGDKGFVGSIPIIEEAGLHSMIILKNNMKQKNKDLDRFITKLRSPFESVFSKQQKRTRYKGVEKNQAAEFLYAIAHNLRRLLVLEKTSIVF
jgi:IS5 family transposase